MDKFKSSFSSTRARYLGIPIADIEKTNESLYNRYKKNKNQYSAMGRYIEDMPARDVYKPIISNKFEQLKKRFDEVSTADSFEYADQLVYEQANKLASDKELKMINADYAAFTAWDNDAKKKVADGKLDEDTYRQLLNIYNTQYSNPGNVDDKTGTYKGTWNAQNVVEDPHIAKQVSEEMNKLVKSYNTEPVYYINPKDKNAHPVLLRHSSKGDYYFTQSEDYIDKRTAQAGIMQYILSKPENMAYINQAKLINDFNTFQHTTTKDNQLDINYDTRYTKRVNQKTGDVTIEASKYDYLNLYKTSMGLDNKGISDMVVDYNNRVPDDAKIDIRLDAKGNIQGYTNRDDEILNAVFKSAYHNSYPERYIINTVNKSVNAYSYNRKSSKFFKHSLLDDAKIARINAAIGSGDKVTTQAIQIGAKYTLNYPTYRPKDTIDFYTKLNQFGAKVSDFQTDLISYALQGASNSTTKTELKELQSQISQHGGKVKLVDFDVEENKGGTKPSNENKYVAKYEYNGKTYTVDLTNEMIKLYGGKKTNQMIKVLNIFGELKEQEEAYTNGINNEFKKYEEDIKNKVKTSKLDKDNVDNLAFYLLKSIGYFDNSHVNSKSKEFKSFVKKSTDKEIHELPKTDVINFVKSYMTKEKFDNLISGFASSKFSKTNKLAIEFDKKLKILYDITSNTSLGYTFPKVDSNGKKIDLYNHTMNTLSSLLNNSIANYDKNKDGISNSITVYDNSGNRLIETLDKDEYEASIREISNHLLNRYTTTTTSAGKTTKVKNPETTITSIGGQIAFYVSYTSNNQTKGYYIVPPPITQQNVREKMFQADWTKPLEKISDYSMHAEGWDNFYNSDNQFNPVEVDYKYSIPDKNNNDEVVKFNAPLTIQTQYENGKIKYLVTFGFVNNGIPLQMKYDTIQEAQTAHMKLINSKVKSDLKSLGY